MDRSTTMPASATSAPVTILTVPGCTPFSALLASRTKIGIVVVPVAT